jgi:hypothetical protein
LEKFTTSYNKLIDAILELNKETRFILLSPIRHEKLPPPLPDPARHNEMLASYMKAIQSRKVDVAVDACFSGIP